MFAVGDLYAFVAVCLARIEITRELVGEIAILAGVSLGIVLLPHILAAKMLAPHRTLPRILSAILIHTVLSVATFIGRATYEVIDPTKVWIIIVFAFVLAVLAMSSIYRFSIGSGILYAIVVNLLSILVYRAIAPIAQSTVLAPYFGGQAHVEEAAVPGEGSSNQPARPHPAQTFASVEAAQAAAMRRYPDLGKSGSPFNQRFLEKHRRYQKERPDKLSGNDWPMVIAAEVAAELGAP